ncbi:MAG: response regulator [Candidatus Thermoplasmatota archaeon]|nr:response regulator [Euryarchaeota archaeon]MBU4032401.1 response regulator [Candidatus Thermoplasmatota archaeon]MBU4071730.1 response regulator [Candidatus Thermoplasmatota archaeon]MBU4591811.1 response regulator [Candidatus Thermoplasmatota archaeon]
MQILVVDDYKKSRDQLKTILRKAGYDVITAKDGIDAFHKYRENKIEIAFIDWTMPRMDGLDLCYRIRDYNLKTGQVSYLVLVTSKSTKRNMVDGLDAGADDFVLKPYSEDIVLSRVEVAKRVLETKYNKLPKSPTPLKARVIEPIAILNREHVLIHKITGILEVISNMLGGGVPIPKKLLKWATSSAFMLNWQLHEEKELFYIDTFIYRAQEVHGKTAQLYSRSSLTLILEEHDLIKKLLLDMQVATRFYDLNDRKSVLKLSNIIARYLPLVRFHSAREEDVFLPFTQRYFTDEDIVRMLADYKRIDREVGPENLNKRLKEIEQLEKILKIKEKAV